MKRLNRHRRRGIAIIYIVITFFMLMAFVALALDTSRVLVVAHELQAAADASALAGAEYVQTSTTTALTQAQTLGGQNQNSAEGVPITIPTADVTFGYWNQTTRTFDSSGKFAPNAVKVVASRINGKNTPLPFLFPSLVAGATSSNVQRSAIAMLGDKNLGVVVLNLHNPGALSFTGSGSRPKIDVQITDANGTLTGEYGSVVVNSDNANGFSWNGNPTMDVQNLYLGSAGSAQTGAQATLPSGSSLYTGQAPTTDPLAPLYSGTPAKPSNTVTGADSTGTWPAGYHPNGLPSGAKLASGIHWVDGNVGGVDGSAGVLLFVNSGDVSLSGNDVLTVNTMSGNQWSDLGISLWINQGNLSMGGKTNINNDGILYLTGKAPNGGNASLTGTPSSVGSMLITDTLSITGNSQINIVHGPDSTKLEHVWLVQ